MRAHQGSVSYAHFAVRAVEVEVAFQITEEDWRPLVELDANRDGSLTPDEVRARLPRLAGVLGTRTAIEADGHACAGEPLDADAGERLGTRFTFVRIRYRCPAPIRRLRITCGLFEREHPGHRTLAVIEDNAALMRQHIFAAGSETLDVEVTRAAVGRWQAVREFVGLGVEHIFTGFDHVLFLLGLLVVAPGFRELVKIVTSFTVAHSITLLLATLGGVQLDVRLVESVIALSIAYVAVENLVAREHRRRWVLTFVFGLVHGFGFSNVLREMHIPREVLGWSLAAFNIGVEVGQVAIVALVYPAIAWSRPRPWSTAAVRAVSVLIGLMGLYWFVERALLA